MIFRLILTVSALVLFSCSHLVPSRNIAAIDTAYINIDALGASNTTGSGNSLPLIARLRDHLDVNVTNSDLRRQLSHTRTLIAGDYFFPTNYSFLMQPGFNHRAKVNEILTQWNQEYGLILVGVLPLWESLNVDEQNVARSLDKGGYKNILDTLETYKTAVRTVNATLVQFAKKHPDKVKLLNLKNMITASSDFYNNNTAAYNFPIPANAFHADNLHFTDHGQAFFLNSVVIPVFNPEIPPLVETGKQISNQMRRRGLSRILDSRDNFLNGVNGGYWASFTDSNQFFQKSAIIANGDAPDMQPLLNVMYVIEQVADTRDGFPLYLRFDSNSKEINEVMLDLSSALFYTRITLKKTTPDTFEGWGYDYWLSAKILSPFNPPPRVNYHFVLKKTKVPGLFDLEWTLFPMVNGQSQWLQKNHQTESVRLDSISADFIQQIKSRSGHSVTYKVQAQIQDLN